MLRSLVFVFLFVISTHARAGTDAPPPEFLSKFKTELAQMMVTEGISEDAFRRSHFFMVTSLLTGDVFYVLNFTKPVQLAYEPSGGGGKLAMQITRYVFADHALMKDPSQFEQRPLPDFLRSPKPSTLSWGRFNEEITFHQGFEFLSGHMTILGIKGERFSAVNSRTVSYFYEASLNREEHTRYAMKISRMADLDTGARPMVDAGELDSILDLRDFYLRRTDPVSPAALKSVGSWTLDLSPRYGFLDGAVARARRGSYVVLGYKDGSAKVFYGFGGELIRKLGPMGRDLQAIEFVGGSLVLRYADAAVIYDSKTLEYRFTHRNPQAELTPDGRRALESYRCESLFR